MILIICEKIESYVYPGVAEVKISVTKSSICGLVRFHSYNVNKRFCYYLNLALQHLKVSLNRSVTCLDRFKLFYVLEHVEKVICKFTFSRMIYVVYMNYMRYKKSVTWAF